MSRFAAILVFAFCLTLSSAISDFPSPPKIVKQPPSDEILYQVAEFPKKPFTIECKAEGKPAPNYRWTKDGKPFEWTNNRISQQPGQGTLVFNTPRADDQGQYQCFATNEWGTATSNSVFVRRAELNSFKEKRKIRKVTAQEGKPFKLECQPPHGLPKPSVQWLIDYVDSGIKSINDSRITVDPEGNLWFSSVTREDASSDSIYSCAASSTFLKEFSVGNHVELTVMAQGTSSTQNQLEPVQQYVTRNNQIAHLGKEIELFCIYGGTPLPEIKWTKLGGSLHLDRVSYDNYGKSLLIHNISFADEGTYQCEASNGVCTAKSHSINISVHSAPFFTVEPEIEIIAEDETVEIHCEAGGVPEPVIQWVHNGLTIDRAPVNPRRTVSAKKITIDRITKADIGNYGCNATNSVGYVYKDVYVNVLPPLLPEIHEAPKNIPVFKDDNVTLTCTASGVPKPQVKWMKENTELTDGRYKIKPNGDLIIRNVNILDSGDYKCRASNKVGKDDVQFSLTVKERTRITVAPEDYKVAAGKTTSFRCSVVSDPSLKLRISWQQNGEQIDFESEPRFTVSADNSLTITKTNEMDTATYTCVAKTEIDTVQASAKLIIQDVPNPPQMKEVLCRDREASVSWEPQGDNKAPILHYTVQFSTDFTPNSWHVAAESVPATETTYLIPLSPWCNYTFQVIAWNKIGQSEPSPPTYEVCTTQPAVPSKNPDSVAAKGTKPDNLVITWTPMPEVEHNAPRFRYNVMWRRDVPDAPWQSDDIKDWRTDRHVVPNLEPDQRYQIKVVATNRMGQSTIAAKEVVGYAGKED